MGMAMNNELINVIMPQSFKRLINPFHNVFSRQPALVGRTPHRHGHLCGEGVLIPR